jgi:transposase
MGRAEVLQGVRQMRFEGLLERHERGELSQGEAAEMLGVSERTFRRWRDRLRDEGPAGLRDRRIGKPSSRRAAVEEILRMLGLYEERYSGFTVKHFHEQLHKRHHYKLGYTVTRLALQGAGLVRPAPRRSAHRKKRPRRPMVGMMLHQSLPSRKRGMRRASPGCRAMIGNTIWWLRSTTRPARSTRAFS